MTHEEKLSEAKRLYATANADQRYVLESLFPELAESEDERIRKALMRFHKSTIDVDGIKGEDIVAWLEKQVPKSKWTEEDSLMIDSIIDTIKWLEGKGATDMKIDWLKSFKQRMEERQ